VVHKFLYPMFLASCKLCHSQITLLSVSLALYQLPSSLYFTLLLICCNSIRLSSSSHWIFLGRSTPSDTQPYSPSCQVGRSRPANPSLQLAGRLLQQPLAPHHVQRRCLMHKKYHCQHHTGLKQWASSLHCHSS